MDSRQDLAKYVRELQSKARLERKLARIRATRDKAEAAASKLPETRRQPVRHKNEGRKRKP